MSTPWSLATVSDAGLGVDSETHQQQLALGLGDEPGDDGCCQAVGVDVGGGARPHHVQVRLGAHALVHRCRGEECASEGVTAIPTRADADQVIRSVAQRGARHLPPKVQQRRYTRLSGCGQRVRRRWGGGGRC